MDVKDIKLSRQTFKALASDTRVDVLKLLSSRRFTQSEIAKELSLSIPTIKEHLSALVADDLVVVEDEGRKWKYYSLTVKGRAIVEPRDVKIWLVLSVFVLSVVGGFFTRPIVALQSLQVEQFADASAKAMMAQVAVESVAPVSSFYVVFVAASVVSGFLLLIFVTSLIVRMFRKRP